jgi:exportin-7
LIDLIDLKQPDPNAKPNMNPIIVGKPVFVKQIKNAKLYTIADGDEQIYVTHLWGTPYEMGYAHGSLLKDRMIALVNSFWAYMESQVVSYMKRILTIILITDCE